MNRNKQLQGAKRNFQRYTFGRLCKYLRAVIQLHKLLLLWQVETGQLLISIQYWFTNVSEVKQQTSSEYKRYVYF